MKSTPFYVIVKLKEFFNDRIEVEGAQDLKINTTFRPEWFVKQEAEVVAVPDHVKSSPVYNVYPGSPSPKIGTMGIKIRNLYHSVNNFIFAEDFGSDIRVGDRVYFHYNCISYPGGVADRGVSLVDIDEDGTEYHRILVNEIYFRERDGNIKMLFGRAMVSPLVSDMEEVEIGGKKMKAIIEDDLIISTKEERKYLEGIIDHISDSAGPERRDNLESGDRILYLPNSEFENTVGDKQVFIMLYNWIVAKYNGECYSPLGKFVKIKVEKDPEDLLSVPGSPIRIMTGTVLEKGPNSDDSVNVGDKVIFNSISAYFVEYKENTIFVVDSDIHFVCYE
jgi:co-chaperonin GroES (HSP10)